MIKIKNKQIIINGEPRLIMCGEIHYFRLNKNDWQDRINKLKAAGCNAVATYVPWSCHEPVEGRYDLSGATRPELDLSAFIDLCQENGLYFIVRPGPFIMAEMKNEGIPAWIYKKYPHIIPIGWDKRKATTPTVDYLAPDFLREVEKWYKQVMNIVQPRLYQNGGMIIGVQLDNEVGMLAWVSNGPDLTDFVIEDFMKWLKSNYSEKELQERYSFVNAKTSAYQEAIRSPKEAYTLSLHRDLGRYMRHRFAKYIAELRRFAENNGVRDIPFFVNIHGTGAGRGFTYPIGISQLYESYTQEDGYLSGSDHYFGDLDMETFQDLYLINGLMDAVHNEDQPLTSLEFNCGDGNFGENYGGRYDPSAVDLKARMSIAQGNRLLNYYLFSGGTNYRLTDKTDDGNDRIATTGERHGFAAPVTPEGELNYTYPRMARSIKTMMAMERKLAVMNEVHDDVAFGFIPDYYMTEYRYPESKKVEEVFQNIEENRASGAWEIMARAMLLAGYRFTGIDIQNKEINPEDVGTIVLPSARYMSQSLQKKLVDYIESGGCLLLYGEVPLFDMEGNECEVLVNALQVTHKGYKRSNQNFYLSVAVEQESWLAPQPEIRTHFAQLFNVHNDQSLLRVYNTNDICGFEANIGKGKAIAITTAYRCDIEFFKRILERLGAKANLTHDCEHHGIFMTSVKAGKEQFLHVLNLDGFDKTFHVSLDGNKLFAGSKLELHSKDGLMLPLNVRINEKIKVIYSTAEIFMVRPTEIQFRLTQSKDRIVLQTDLEIQPNKTYEIEKQANNTVVIHSNKHAKVDNMITVKFK